jgi:hypothetical protein
MSPRPLSFPLALVLFASSLSVAQTATCTTWKTIQYPSGWGVPLDLFFGGINRWGTIVGPAAWIGGGPQGGPSLYGFVRYSGGSFRTYLPPNAASAIFTRRNNSGVTVGYYGDNGPPYNQHGIVISGSSSVTVNYPGAAWTILMGINNWGTIVGYHYDSTGSGRPDGFMLKNGKFTSIHFPNSVLTAPNAINDKAVVVGFYWDAQLVQHGFVFANGVYKTLDNPKNAPQFSPSGNYLSDINGSGVITGYYYVGLNIYSFIYSNGVFKDVLPSNGTDTAISGINGYGVVVGTTTLSSGISTMFTAHCQ